PLSTTTPPVSSTSTLWSYTDVASEKISSWLIAVSNSASRMRRAHSSRNRVRFWRRCATNSRNKPTLLWVREEAASFSVLFFSLFMAWLRQEYSTEFTHYKPSNGPGLGK